MHHGLNSRMLLATIREEQEVISVVIHAQRVFEDAGAVDVSECQVTKLKFEAL